MALPCLLEEVCGSPHFPSLERLTDGQARRAGFTCVLSPEEILPSELAVRRT